MHSLNIVHCDIKPSNVIYNKQTGKLTLVGFNLSKQLNSLDEKMHQPYGTFLYMAPEMIIEKEYDYTVDWYAYGKTLLLLFGGTIEMEESVDNGISVTFLNNFFPLNDAQNKLVSHCIDDKKEERIRSLDQIKKHKYFRGFQWDTIHDEPNTVKPSVIRRLLNFLF